LTDIYRIFESLHAKLRDLDKEKEWIKILEVQDHEWKNRQPNSYLDLMLDYNTKLHEALALPENDLQMLKTFAQTPKHSQWHTEDWRKHTIKLVHLLVNFKHSTLQGDTLRYPSPACTQSTHHTDRKMTTSKLRSLLAQLKN